MSIRYLLDATINRLTANVPLQDSECRIENDGQPPPDFGKRYVAVWPSAWNPGPTGEVMMGIDEIYSIVCTLTVRASAIPRDRDMMTLWEGDTYGLHKLARKIVSLVHQNYDILTEANRLITGADKVIEPFRWAGTDAAPVPRSADWLWGKSPSVENAAYTLDVRFTGARRLQSAANLE